MAGSDRAARRLLRAWRTPHVFEDDPAARALSVATGTPAARDAFRALAETTLAEYDPRCLQIVRRVDFGGEPTKVVADDLFMSRRHFFRFRARAVDALEHALAQRLRRTLPSSDELDAVTWFARGQSLCALRTRRALEEALRCFDRSATCDPRFARAYAGAAEAHFILGQYLICDAPASFERARALTRRALELDRNLPDALATAGALAFYADRDAPRARELYDRALEADAGSVRALIADAWFRMAASNAVDAITNVARALARLPASIELQTTLGIACLVAEDVPRAIRVLEGVIAVQPSASLARYHLAKALILHERLDEAGDHLERLVAEEPRASFVSADGHVRALRGDLRGAERSLAVLDAALAGGRRQPHYLRAVVHAGLGDDRRAAAELHLALEANEPWTSLAHIDSLLAPVHGSRRFATVMDASRIARAV